MTFDPNPHAEQMADESMLRTLSAQAEAIWPAEQAFFARYELYGPIRVADVGCGSGEVTARIANLYREAEVVGIDILERSVSLARLRHAALAPRVRFDQGNAFELALPSASFDLVVCRHVTQAVPEAPRVLAELVRICKPGGWVHVASEDYGMLHMPVRALDPDRLWQGAVIPYGQAVGADARIGRHTWSFLRQLGLAELRVDYVVVDTLRVPRATLAAIFEAWRDGYTAVLAAKSALGAPEVRALFDQIIESVLDPEQYAVWQLPVVSGKKL